MEGTAGYRLKIPSENKFVPKIKNKMENKCVD
jgi:hypothetical protein